MKRSLLVVSFLFSSVALAINTVSDGYKIDDSATVKVDAHSTCKNITNSSGVSQFVATKTSTEWASFLAHLPSGMTAADCTSVFESFEAGGSCPAGWTTVGVSPQCSTVTYYKNDGSYGLYLRGWIDYGSGTGLYKAYDLTGVTTIEVDVVGVDDPAYNLACLQIFSSPPGPYDDSSCSTGVLHAQRSTTGKLTLNLSGQTGTYYVYLGGYDSYQIFGVVFDSLTLH